MREYLVGKNKIVRRTPNEGVKKAGYRSCKTLAELKDWIKDKGMTDKFDMRLGHRKLIDELDDYYKENKE